MNTVVENALGTLLVCVLYPLWFLFGSNGIIRMALREDVARNCGPKMLRKVYKREKFSFWQKFFFLPFRRKTKKHHYILFIINLAVCPINMLLMILYVWLGPESWVRTVFIVTFSIEFLTTIFGGVVPYFWWSQKRIIPRPPKKKRQDW